MLSRSEIKPGSIRARVLLYIEAHFRLHGDGPTQIDVQRHLGYASRTPVKREIGTLGELGYVIPGPRGIGRTLLTMQGSLAAYRLRNGA